MPLTAQQTNWSWAFYTYIEESRTSNGRQLATAGEGLQGQKVLQSSFLWFCYIRTYVCICLDQFACIKSVQGFAKWLSRTSFDSRVTSQQESRNIAKEIHYGYRWVSDSQRLLHKKTLVLHRMQQPSAACAGHTYLAAKSCPSQCVLCRRLRTLDCYSVNMHTCMLAWPSATFAGWLCAIQGEATWCL